MDERTEMPEEAAEEGTVIAFTPKGTRVEEFQVGEASSRAEAMSILAEITKFIGERRDNIKGALFIAFDSENTPFVMYGGQFTPSSMAGQLEAVKFDLFTAGISDEL